MKDLMGMAIWDYFHEDNPENLKTETSISEIDELPIAYLFRTYDEMNALEQKALDLAKGNVLDVGAGAGAGSHSLYLQNERKLNVLALDRSAKSIEIAKLRGVKKVFQGNILHFKHAPFDAILLLMNGTGIFQSLNCVDTYLQKLHSLVAPQGQILIDGTDIIYMYDQDEDGGVYVPMDGYYGELDYTLHYKGETEDPMKWLYLDFNTLRRSAENNGFCAELVLEHDYSYLARLVKRD